MRRQHLLSLIGVFFYYRSCFYWKYLDNLKELVIQIPAGRGMWAWEKAARTLKLAHMSILIGNGVCYVLGGFAMYLLHQGLWAFHLLCSGHPESQKGSGHSPCLTGKTSRHRARFIFPNFRYLQWFRGMKEELLDMTHPKIDIWSIWDDSHSLGLCEMEPRVTSTDVQDNT